MLASASMSRRHRKTAPKKAQPPGGHSLVPIQIVESRIFVLRGRRAILDRDLAELYGVPLKRLNEQVKRNLDRFPDDFMFQLTIEEAKAVVASRSQIATLNRGGNVKYAPFAFTEHGVVMLANVLKSSTAVRASIKMVRAFVHIRGMLVGHAGLRKRARSGNTTQTCRRSSRCFANFSDRRQSQHAVRSALESDVHSRESATSQWTIRADPSLLHV